VAKMAEVLLLRHEVVVQRPARFTSRSSFPTALSTKTGSKPRNTPSTGSSPPAAPSCGWSLPANTSTSATVPPCCGGHPGELHQPDRSRRRRRALQALTGPQPGGYPTAPHHDADRPDRATRALWLACRPVRLVGRPIDVGPYRRRHHEHRHPAGVTGLATYHHASVHPRGSRRSSALAGRRCLRERWQRQSDAEP
jgi:hypothetical protein